MAVALVIHSRAFAPQIWSAHGSIPRKLGSFCRDEALQGTTPRVAIATNMRTEPKITISLFAFKAFRHLAAFIGLALQA